MGVRDGSWAGVCLVLVTPPAPTEGSIGRILACFTSTGRYRQIALPTCARAKDRLRVQMMTAPGKPLLMVDIDGVISLFGVPGPAGARPGGRILAQMPPRRARFHSIEGIPHFLSSTAAAHLLGLAEDFDLVWASGWEERADEHLPRLLGLPRGLPFLRFERSPGRSNAHWKLDAIDAYAGDAPAGLDRRCLQRGLPRMGRRAPGTDAARAHRARAGAHIAGGAACWRRGRGSARGRDRQRSGHVQRALRPPPATGCAAGTQRPQPCPFAAQPARRETGSEQLPAGPGHDLRRASARPRFRRARTRCGPGAGRARRRSGLRRGTAQRAPRRARSAEAPARAG